MARFLTVLCIFLSVAFVLILLALHILQPDVDPMVSGISFYALGESGILIGLALGLVGLAGVALALALLPGSASAASRLGLFLLIAWGISSILAGGFPLDAPGAAPTTSGKIHNLAGLNFLLIAAASLLVELSGSAAVSGGGRSGTRGFAWLILVSAALLFIFNGPLSGLQLGGAFQRFYWLAVILWLVFKARAVMVSERYKSRGLKPTAVS